MKLYNFTKEELLKKISEGLKNPLVKQDVFRKKINLNHLKRIDKVFNKGLQFYIDPSEPKESKDASIFFRKENFNSELNLGSRKIVNQFEETKISLSAISKLADFNVDRILPGFTIKDNPEDVAINLRSKLYPHFKEDQKAFLRALIEKFAEYNIFVFEFVETWNKKEKANIDGFYLSPNTIILKRQQRSLRREIFTLIHEIGHYLINEEEIDELDYEKVGNSPVNKIEKWCNDFSYFFLVGEFNNNLRKIEKATVRNDYYHDLIKQVSRQTHLSELALYTRLLIENKVSPKNYSKIKGDMKLAFRENEERRQKKRDREKEAGLESFARSPKPIKSPLLNKILQSAYLDGIINEMEFCKRLDVKPKELEKYLQ